MTVSLPTDGNGGGDDGASSIVVDDPGTSGSNSSNAEGSSNDGGIDVGGTGADLARAVFRSAVTVEDARRDFAQQYGRRVLAARTDSAGNVMNNRAQAPAAARRPAAAAAKSPVLAAKRVLFGRPREPDATRAWLDSQMSALVAAPSRSWNFDFANDCPMRGSPSDRYAWERVAQPQKRAAEDDDEAAGGGGDVAQQQDAAAGGGGGEPDGRRGSVKKQKQSKVTGKDRFVHSLLLRRVCVDYKFGGPGAKRKRKKKIKCGPTGGRFRSLTRRVLSYVYNFLFAVPCSQRLSHPVGGNRRSAELDRSHTMARAPARPTVVEMRSSYYGEGAVNPSSRRG